MKQIPSKAEILTWISENPTKAAKRDIAKAFGIKGAQRIDLKRVLKELEADGKLTKRRSSYRDAEDLPPVSVLEITGPDAEGDLFARPLEWAGKGAEPVIMMLARDGDPALAKGDRILARLTVDPTEDFSHTARMIRRIGSNPLRILGIFRAGSEGGRVLPIEKGSDKEWSVAEGATGGAKDGELVEAEQSGPKGRMGLPIARIVARLGNPSEPRAVSLIAIHQHGIPDHFPDEVIAEADAALPVKLSKRLDLRDTPLVTIDPWDARDHDDACYVETHDNGEMTIWVAIADVAHYVTGGSALDREARNRGNSTYFPDRVVPMLPDVLSGDLCSLHEGVERACLAVAMRIDAEGNKISHAFHRGLMKSVASLNYEEVQDAMDGAPNEKVAPLVSEIIRPLYAAYAALKIARAVRQPLELDLPERQIILDDMGKVSSVNYKERLDAHRLIEEFMVLANVCAAETLLAKKTPHLLRVHEEPTPEKLDALREVANASGMQLAKGQVLQTAHLNRLLEQAKGTDHYEVINISTLRSMTQAYYNPENFGHFGLALKAYAHFTSPIRRYADLIVHRALITAHGWGKDGLTPFDVEMMAETGQKISDTERRSMTAERDTTDRYLAAFLSERLGAEMPGRISGIAKFGVFVKLDETGADALIPIRSLGDEYFDYDQDSQTLMGSKTGIMIGLGVKVVVKLIEAAPVTGGLIAEIVTLDERTLPKGAGRGRGKPPRRKFGSGKKKAAKIKKKVHRSRS
ncbi:MAG: ribonuclease R [Loktanella sp.]|jgi:ribonuclease R|nr:ribonuclease R [Loktanella sp.]MDO7622993.1 ribonuclease R [Loktanella sp.]MDO7625106.1 ribonuclease R [Loktanella sp.]MDO7664697.1 ribonuclease R [Loktanella sp.]MDO7685565.1 ribonuclease R [Loktanella sp.]